MEFILVAERPNGTMYVVPEQGVPMTFGSFQGAKAECVKRKQTYPEYRYCVYQLLGEAVVAVPPVTFKARTERKR